MAIFKTKIQKIYELEQQLVFEKTVRDSLAQMPSDKAATLFVKHSKKFLEVNQKLTPWTKEDVKEAEKATANAQHKIKRLVSNVIPQSVEK